MKVLPHLMYAPKAWRPAEARAIVMAPLTWFQIQTQLRPFVAELNVVKCRKFRPRDVVTRPPRTSVDRTTYQGYAEAACFHPDEHIETGSPRREAEGGQQP
jgi:hypothetical protein